MPGIEYGTFNSSDTCVIDCGKTLGALQAAWISGSNEYAGWLNEEEVEKPIEPRCCIMDVHQAPRCWTMDAHQAPRCSHSALMLFMDHLPCSCSHCLSRTITGQVSGCPAMVEAQKTNYIVCHHNGQRVEDSSGQREDDSSGQPGEDSSGQLGEDSSGQIEWKRRDACEKHIKNKGHIKQVQASLTTGVKRQLSIEGAIQAQKKAKDDKVEFIMDTTEMFLKANIPIEKLDNPVVRSWMGKYIKGSGDLPSASWLRREYVPKCGALAKENIKVSLANKSVAIFCDETTDRSGNCVFAILGQTEECLKACGALTCAKLYSMLAKNSDEIKVIKALGYLFDPTKLLSRPSSSDGRELERMFKDLPAFLDLQCDFQLGHKELCTLISEQIDSDYVDVVKALIGLKHKGFGRQCLGNKNLSQGSSNPWLCPSSVATRVNARSGQFPVITVYPGILPPTRLGHTFISGRRTWKCSFKRQGNKPTEATFGWSLVDKKSRRGWGAEVANTQQEGDDFELGRVNSGAAGIEPGTSEFVIQEVGPPKKPFSNGAMTVSYLSFRFECGMEKVRYEEEAASNVGK
uniref:(California timema) hypothetical protein n=1 Tax=Timema californicum TaxID=61474 RepID=A0A7R9JAS9_TIMCA|nr:unnamed protein product [Timema californicum]